MAGRNDESAREQFLAEAQDLIEALSRDLLLLEQSHAQGAGNPEPLNDLFRGVHTLKGLAGMFGLEHMARLSHLLEDLLEDLRLGRVDLNTQALDTLFEGLEGFQRLLSEAREPRAGQKTALDLDAFAERLQAATAQKAQPRNVLDEYDFDPALLAVLTEYEEHRLRANLERGHTIYRFKVRVGLDMIDSTLATLKQRTQSIAEVITYLPSMEPEVRDSIDIEMLLATGVREAQLRDALDHAAGTLIPIQRRSRVSMAPQRMSIPIGGAPLPGSASLAPKPPAATRAKVVAPAAEGAPSDQLSLRSLTSVVRVDIRKLDHLMNVVGDLGVVRGAFARFVERLRGRLHDRELLTEAQRIHRSFERYLGDVQEGVLDVRMVPLSQAFDKLAVVVRQIAREQDKRVQLVVRGGDTEIDKLIAEDIADPLMHIARNAVDHGLESRKERVAAGKPDTATVKLTATQRGNHVVIEVQDDGRGIDPANIREAAMRKGTLAEHQLADLTPAELIHLIFLPGFSTSSTVTDVSGRGIGMDVVKTNIQRLGGAVEVQSEIGTGTTFTITLPVTLAIIRSLLFSVEGRTMAIPLSVVAEVLRLDPKALRTVDNREILDLRGTTLPLCRLRSHFRFSKTGAEPEGFVIVVSVGKQRLGFLVESLAGQQDIVVKPLGKSLSQVSGIAGATDLGDGKLVLVLDAAALLDELLGGKAARLIAGGYA
jgi:two-component system chemotaxis sensor kinase CheA